MTGETKPQEKPEGERWLELIGYGHLKGQPTGYEIDGEPVLAEQFDLLCGEEGREMARRVFTALEHMDPRDPRYEKFLGAARGSFDRYFSSTEASS